MVMIIRKKQILVALICSLALIITPIICNGFVENGILSNSQNTNWGLYFTQNGEKPKGNASIEFLKEYNAYYVDDSDEKVIYLTFDAGYENGNTPQILDVLNKHNVKATFFVVGNFIKTEPELTKQIAEQGHIVGNHTSTHPDMSSILSLESFKKEIEELELMYEEATGKKMQKFYRPPQGKYSETNLKMANELGYKTVFWSLAYVDWYQDNQPTKEEAFEKLLPRVHPGAVVLLHSTSKTNALILDELLTEWKKMGYSFSTLDKLCK